MDTHDFRVHISGGTVSLDDWRLAMEAKENELPQLSESQKDAARRIGIAESEYARGVLAEMFGEREQHSKGKRLGVWIGEYLNRTGQGWKLETLVRRGTESLWIAKIEAVGVSSRVEIPIDLADDVVGSNGRFGKGQLEALISAELEISAVRKAS